MNTRKCKVVYGREHLANVWLLPDGRWQLEPTETHVPINLLHHVRLFDAYVGALPPPLVREWQVFTGLQLDPREPVETLIQTSAALSGIRFLPEGR